MERVAVNGIELEAEIKGSGEPVLLIHGALTPYTWGPLLTQTTLPEHYRLINYPRRNFAGSRHAPARRSDHVSDALALMRHFGVERAHIVGHSGGGELAIRLTLQAPDAVHSLALLEAALLMTDESGPTPLDQARKAREEGNTAKFVEIWMNASSGAEGRRSFDRELPAGWFEQAVADADWAGRHSPEEAPLFWNLEVAQRITQPVLLVVGAQSRPNSHELHELVLRSLPQAEPFVLADATHALQVMNPRGMAEGLAGFFARHPLSAAA